MKTVDVNALIQQGSNIKINNINFDQISFKNLLVDINDQSSLLEHLQKQAAGLAYYGMLFKQVQQQLQLTQRKRNQYYMEKYQMSQLILAKTGGSKPTKTDIDSLTYQKYKKVFDELDEKIEKLTQQFNILQQYYQGWKQKGYVLNNMVSLVSSGLIKLNN